MQNASFLTLRNHVVGRGPENDNVGNGGGRLGVVVYLRAELKPAGVGVTIVYPPDTDTPQLTEENLTKPAETKALTAAAGLWTADAVARATLDGVRRGRFAVTPGLQLTALSWLHSLIAPVLRWSFDRTAARAKR